MNVDNFFTKIDIIHIFRQFLCNLPDGRFCPIFFDKITVAQFFVVKIYMQIFSPGSAFFIPKKPAEP